MYFKYFLNQALKQISKTFADDGKAIACLKVKLLKNLWNSRHCV